MTRSDVLMGAALGLVLGPPALLVALAIILVWRRRARQRRRALA